MGKGLRFQPAQQACFGRFQTNFGFRKYFGCLGSVLVNQLIVHSGGVTRGRVSGSGRGVGVTCQVSCDMSHVNKFTFFSSLDFGIIFVLVLQFTHVERFIVSCMRGSY